MISRQLAGTAETRLYQSYTVLPMPTVTMLDGTDIYCKDPGCGRSSRPWTGTT